MKLEKLINYIEARISFHEISNFYWVNRSELKLLKIVQYYYPIILEIISTVVLRRETTITITWPLCVHITNNRR